MGCGSSSNAGDVMRQQQQQQQANTNASVAQINNAFQGFTPQFFQGVSNAYTNWANPQLQQQYQQAQNQTGFKLANQGLLNSSQATGMYNQLGQAQTQAQQQVAQQAQQQANQLQTTVAGQKANLIGQAQTATSPSTMGQEAVATAAGFSAPSAFQPLGQLFGNYTNEYLANQTANTYNPQTIALASLMQNQSLGQI